MLAHLPNLICFIRILMAVPAVQALTGGEYALAFWICVAAGLSDMLDGWLAKHFNWSSEFGKNLDPVADKLFIVTVFVTMIVIGMVPLWLGVLVILRDVWIGVGAWIYKVLYGPVEGHPTAVSKVNTAVQIAYVAALLAAAAAAWFPQWLAPVLAWATLVTTVVSGVHYTAIYIRKAAAVTRARRGQA
jgi:cardiolipin synthase